jgi:thiol-disulfide isomerase/thioredoxin
VTAGQVVLAAVLAGAAAIGIVRLVEDQDVLHRTAGTSAGLPDEGAFPSLGGASQWLNTQPLTPAQLKGKVVLVDFWTFTCINWLRSEPYVRAWADKYKDDGLVVIGVHTPEFSVEKNVDNVQRAVSEMDIRYPVAIDTGYGMWNAFRNYYWPAIYVIDAQGRIRYHQFGEGQYEQTERVLQELLADAGAAQVPTDLVSPNPQGAEVAADWTDLKSPETYVGSDKAENFASAEGMAVGQPRAYTAPPQLALNHWALSGRWTVGNEAVVSSDAGSAIAYSFHARDLHLVMGPAAPGGSVRFRVLIDGQPPGDAHGSDVDAMGNGIVTEPRLYQLVRQPGSIADHRFQIEFLDAGAQAFSFTFG